MKKNYLLIFAFFTLVSLKASGQQLNLTFGQTPTQLIQNIILGNGIISSNESGIIDSLSAASFINTGVPGFSLGGGVILSSGGLQYINSNASYFNSTAIGMAGDSDLDNIVAPRITYDAQILQFDFKSTSDSVEFNFVFSSEEYNDYANTNFNDVFAFLVTGPGYSPNTNVALIPGTSTPVSINNINNGNAVGTASGPCMNCAYFIDNVNTNAVALSADGYTVPIKIKFPVWPCSDYTFKIAIADAGDAIFDSQVMVEQNSFVACPLMQIMQQTVPINAAINICMGGTVVLNAPPASNYLWSTGDTTQSITVSQPGNYSFTVNGGTCLAISNTVNVVAQGVIQPPVITQQNNQLISTVTGNITSYQWYLNGNLIAGAIQPDYTFSLNGCYTVSVINSAGCEAVSNSICVNPTGIPELATSNILVMPNPVTSISQITSPFKSGTTTSVSIFDLAGRTILQKTETDKGKLIIEKGNIKNGIYFLELKNSGSTDVYRVSIMIL